MIDIRMFVFERRISFAHSQKETEQEDCSAVVLC